MSREITFVEKELGFPIMREYPLMKFLQELDDLIWFNQEAERRQKR